jgi:hypothetical protein
MHFWIERGKTLFALVETGYLSQEPIATSSRIGRDQRVQIYYVVKKPIEGGNDGNRHETILPPTNNLMLKVWCLRNT